MRRKVLACVTRHCVYTIRVEPSSVDVPAALGASAIEDAVSGAQSSPDMPRKPRDVTDAELSILQVLWDRGAANVRELVGELYPARTPSDLATVQKLLSRLEDKECIQRNRDTWPHTFKPTIQREDLIGRRLRSTAEELCAGSLSPLLTHLVKTTQLSREDRALLRDLLDELDENADTA